MRFIFTNNSLIRGLFKLFDEVLSRLTGKQHRLVENIFTEAKT